MQTSFRRAAAWLGLTALLALTVGLAGVPVAHADPTVAVTDSASFRPCDRSDQANCANGSLITFFLSASPTTFRGTFDYPNWPAAVYDNEAIPFSIALDECGGAPQQPLRILYIGDTPEGGVQVNAYQQGNVRADTPGFGTCAGIADPVNGRFQDVTWRVTGATDSPFGTTPVLVPGRLWHTAPGFLQNYSSNGDTISGFHFTSQQWSKSGHDEFVSLVTCLADPARCPVRTNGQLNFLVVLGNGFEEDACPSRQACNQTWGFRLGTTSPLVAQYIGPGGYGYALDQLNIRLTDEIQPNVTYAMTELVNLHAGSYQVAPQANLRFRFGPAI